MVGAVDALAQFHIVEAASEKLVYDVLLARFKSSLPGTAPLLVELGGEPPQGLRLVLNFRRRRNVFVITCGNG
jgi:hypothetical protein